MSLYKISLKTQTLMYVFNLQYLVTKATNSGIRLLVPQALYQSPICF
jgi:hypothetical protein